MKDKIIADALTREFIDKEIFETKKKLSRLQGQKQKYSVAKICQKHKISKAEYTYIVKNYKTGQNVSPVVNAWIQATIK